MTTEAYFDRIFRGEVPGEELKAYLTDKASRPVTLEDLLGAVSSMRAACVKIKAPEDAVDIVGTGGDGFGTFNISTTAAIIAAGAGVTIAKHGNKAATSKSGSADCLAALGYDLTKGKEEIERDIAEKGIGFLFANLCHPAMRFVAPVRRELKFRTIFNLVGPLTNPAGVNHHALGVYAPEIIPLYIGVLKRSGSKRALVVCGEGGLDEVSISGKTKVAELLEDGSIKEYEFDPKPLLGRYYPAEAIKGGTAEENARITRKILDGSERGACRLVAALNAAVAIVAGGKAGSIEEGFEMALEAIDGGKAAKKLEELTK